MKLEGLKPVLTYKQARVGILLGAVMNLSQDPVINQNHTFQDVLRAKKTYLQDQAK